MTDPATEAEALAIRRRRERAKADHDAATAEAKAFVKRAVEQGVPQTVVAHWMLVDRMTVRKWLASL